MKVLLIVDVQNDFCPGGSLAVTDGNTIIPTINKLIHSDAYDLVVASKDWHPEGHCSFGEWPIHCVQNSSGAALHSDLETTAIDKIIEKGGNPNIDSYSAFFDNAKIESTGLHEFLEAQAESLGIKISDIEIHVVGLALDYCVKFSALDAKQLGYNTSLILDATKAVNINGGDLSSGIPSDADAAITQLKNAGVTITDSLQVLQGIPPEHFLGMKENPAVTTTRNQEIRA